MRHLTQILDYGHGGLIVAGLAALAAWKGFPPGRSRWFVAVTAAGAALAVLAEVVLSTWYLFSPSYIDHIEASVASLTHYFMEGVAVYPRLDSYTFHGLLYGPLLPEVNSLGYSIAGGVLGSKLVGWVAAWVAVVLMALMTPRAQRTWEWAASVAGYSCVLASFGDILTADRADSLLLLFATVALWSIVRLRGGPGRAGLEGLVLVAVLAGLAADLKLHGPAYMVPALALWLAGQQLEETRSRANIVALLAAAAGIAAIMAILPFLPANISVAEYVGYLRLGAKHGLNLELLVANGLFLLSLWVPVLLTLGALRHEQVPYLPLFVATLLVAEIAVTVIASKPGAGPHHLLPFVPYHCFFLQQLLKGGKRPVRSAAVTGLAAVLIGTAWPGAAALYNLLHFDLQWSAQRAASAELHRFADDYPHGMVGIADRESYGLTVLRPWITLRGTLQTDYGAWMDWNLSGVSDAPLAKALEACRIPYLYVPAGGEPFTMNNNYGSGPLFSDAVRESFAGSYSLIHAGQYFNVYGCKVALAGSIKHP